MTHCVRTRSMRKSVSFLASGNRVSGKSNCGSDHLSAKEANCAVEHTKPTLRLCGGTFRFLLSVFMLLCMAATAAADVAIFPVATVSNDLNGLTSTVSIAVYVGGLQTTSSISSYTYSIRMDVDFFGSNDVDFDTPLSFPYTIIPPTRTTGSIWGDSFATVTASSTANSFTFSGSNPTNVTIPDLWPALSNTALRPPLLLGTAVFTVNRPAFGSPNAFYNLLGNPLHSVPTIAQFSNLNGNVGANYYSANFTVTAQETAPVPEPGTAIIFAIGLGATTWRRFRSGRQAAAQAA